MRALSRIRTARGTLDLARFAGTIAYFAGMWREHVTALCAALMLTLVTIFFTLAAPWPIQVVIDHVLLDRPTAGWLRPITDWIGPGEPTILLAACISVVMIAVLHGVADYYSQVLQAGVAHRIGNKLRHRLFKHMQTLSLQFHERSRTGDLPLRLTGDVSMVRDLLVESMFDLVSAVLVIVGLGGLVPLLLPLPWEAEPPGPWRAATAEVRGVRTITASMLSSSRSSSRAPQPWQLVELVFVPEGRDQPVVAVDGVDRGTVAGLTEGARLAIRYPEAAPRAARLVAGERTYRLREWEQLGRDVFWIGVIIVGALALSAVLNRLWRRLLTRRDRLLAEARRHRGDEP